MARLREPNTIQAELPQHVLSNGVRYVEDSEEPHDEFERELAADAADRMQEPYDYEYEQFEYYEYPQTYIGYGQLHRRMGVLLVGVLIVVGCALFVLLGATTGSGEAVTGAINENVIAAVAEQPVQVVTTGGIAPLFTREVQHWAPKIVEWAAAHNLDPNMVATVMQIESCGDPNAVSIAGAQGLFQVMPFHFGAGEQMQDPDTNARRGMNYLAERLVQTNGDAGRAFAGYNGGHVAAGSSWDYWAHETQRYYVWATGIYGDAQTGAAQSETLNQWLTAGGGSLCNQAASRLGLSQ